MWSRVKASAGWERESWWGMARWRDRSGSREGDLELEGGVVGTKVHDLLVQ